MYFLSIEKEVAVDLISLQTALATFNGYLQRLFLTLDSTNFILKPVDALQLAEDYAKIKRFQWRLERQKVSYLDENQSKFYLNICNDILSNYTELLKLELANGGNLALATNIVMNDENEFDLSIFNYKGHPLNRKLLKDIKGV